MSGIEDLQIIEELDPESIRGSNVLVSVCNNISKYTNGNFWYVDLFGDDVLIIVVDVALFFQGKDFIIRLRMVGHVLAVVIGSFLLLVVFFPFLLRACQITVAALLVILIILVVLVAAILLVVPVMVDVPIIVMGSFGIYSFWIVRVIDIWHLNVHHADGRSKRTLHCRDFFHCIGFGFLGGIDSGFWLVAVVTCYCPDGRFLASSLLLAVQVFHSTQEAH